MNITTLEQLLRKYRIPTETWHAHGVSDLLKEIQTEEVTLDEVAYGIGLARIITKVEITIFSQKRELVLHELSKKKASGASMKARRLPKETDLFAIERMLETELGISRENQYPVYNRGFTPEKIQDPVYPHLPTTVWVHSHNIDLPEALVKPEGYSGERAYRWSKF